ncbi:LOW QUALITY PROTEIN: seizure 6-like protein [Leucoraja erinacea]|uniref:LOW QUALITY PROTEIN: seizure 6-like protein n=1 Tax=Leucoraja erinaceus TaxID=7782 RepID=UPI002456BC00|nr:LOW QUALITY PROTEIN: seizure 6-like protein [Leucoraja erinacea]
MVSSRADVVYSIAWTFLVQLLLGSQVQVQDVGLREDVLTATSGHLLETGRGAEDQERGERRLEGSVAASVVHPGPDLLQAVLQKKDLLQREFRLLPSAIPGGLPLQRPPPRQRLSSAIQAESYGKRITRWPPSWWTRPRLCPRLRLRLRLQTPPSPRPSRWGRRGQEAGTVQPTSGRESTAPSRRRAPAITGRPNPDATRPPAAPTTPTPTPQRTSHREGGPPLSPTGARPRRPPLLPARAPEAGTLEEATPGGGEGVVDTSTTVTIITTTVVTSPPTAVPCSISFSGSEGYIDSTDYLPLSAYGSMQCSFNVTVFMGYGVELQVKTLNLSEGEQLSIRGLEEDRWIVLANQVLLVEGQVIRSPTNTISVHFRSFQYGGIGSFRLHYQIFMLSCNFPRRPDYGDVSVLDLHADGTAHFRCNPGYQLQGLQSLTCMNASQPHWSTKEPSCRALCGGTISNGTIGRVLSPNYPANYSNNQTCTWTIAGTKGQKFHMHFEKVSLAGKEDRLIIYNGQDTNSAVLYDSSRNEYFPLEGLISNGRFVQVEFTSDETATAGGFNIRYEAFERGHCFEPYLQNGNFTTTSPSYSVGSAVEFSCDPGYTMEHGSPTIECIDIRDPYWNGTEPLCRALCGGELNSQAGVLLSPNWPEPYDEGEDCIWRIHVGEDKRVLLDVQLLNLTNSDILSLYDGDDLTMRILGQFVGTNAPLKVYSTTSDLTVRFHSDPAGLIFGKGQGFIMNYYEMSRNDTCSDLPEIPNGWKTTSHREMVRGTMTTFQCDPGYDILGSDTLTCQWDLTWSSDPPFCEKIMYCTDPGDVKHASRTISDSKLLVGSTIQFSCDAGFILDGNALVTCYSRETGTPLWTSKLPHCAPEESVACENPGLPENGYQILYKRLYLPGETLTFMCYEGFELVGEVTIRCIIGHPSHWSGPLPSCKAAQYSFEHSLEAAEAAAERPMDGGNMALAIFIPILIISILLGSAYIYVTRCRYHSNLRLPLMSSHPYSQITVETAFDNPIYETGDTREYEVSI